jgi:ubiquinone/menaquinone biosynthesis C-methylase UbiE
MAASLEPQIVGGGLSVSPFDAAAPCFEHHRAVPDNVAVAVRAAVLAAIEGRTPPSILDLGAGSGRFGWPFVAAGDDYIGLDRSGGMLRAFAMRQTGNHKARLVQADGHRLPFASALFDAVLLIAVFGDLSGWRALVDEACRVLRPQGVIAIGHIAAPRNGIDERLKQRLEVLLAERELRVTGRNRREDAAQHLAAAAASKTFVTAATWRVERSPRAFLERHAGGARFSRLPRKPREEALQALAGWAEAQFGSLDTVFFETHRFEMELFRLGEGQTGQCSATHRC